MASCCALFFVALCGAAVGEQVDKPNIVFFLTDDQDNMLGGSLPTTAPGGATPIPRAKAELQDKGQVGTNFFIHTPIW